MIALKTREIGSQMIFTATGPVFQSKFILNGNDHAAVKLSVTVTDPHEILIRCLTTNIRLSVLKHTDQQDIIVIIAKMRLDILEISHHDRDVIAITISVCIDHASLFRQINTGHTTRSFRKCARDRATACSNL